MRYQARAPLRIDFGGGLTDMPWYAAEEGGAVLNAAITRYVRGSIAVPAPQGPFHALRGDRSYVSYSLDLPPGSGLGASAAQTAVWVTLVKTTVANVSDRREIAEIVCRVNDLLGIVEGRQDAYASCLGGIGYYTFDSAVHPERLDLGSPLGEQLCSRLVLVESGVRGQPVPIRERVWAAYGRREAGVAAALAALKRLAGEMKDALLSHDLDTFADLLTENWENQKRLDPAASNARLDEIFALASRNGARGGKVCGVGGGGCVLFLAEAGQTERLRRALRAHKLPILDFSFDTFGVHLDKG